MKSQEDCPIVEMSLLLLFVMKKLCVFFEVGTELLHTVYMSFGLQSVNTCGPISFRTAW
jgi:hypothetical protein